MWDAGPADAGDELRQGDLLTDLLLPAPVLPISFIQTGPEPPERDAQAVIRAKRRSFVVVSQCCTIENGRHVALAPVQGTGRLTDDQKLPFTWESPDDVPDDSALGFAYGAMGLDPIPGHLEPKPEGSLKLVNFEEIQSYSGPRESLIERRVARMTPVGRRRLRLRLAYFWGRPEDEDRAALEAAGISAM